MKCYGYQDDPFISHHYVIKEWVKALKSHPWYEVIMVEDNATPADVIKQLTAYTNNLLDGYQWRLSFSDERYGFPEVNLCYWKYHGECEFNMLPIDWLDDHEDEAIRTAGFHVMYGVAEAFGIDLLKGRYTEYEFQEWETDEELDDYLINSCGYDFETTEFLDERVLYRSYKNGRIDNLDQVMRKAYETDITDRLNYIMEKDPQMYAWLCKGVDLLKGPTPHINQFHFQEDTTGDERSANITDLTFFPYSFTDTFARSMDSLLDDTVNNDGVEGYYEWGVLAAKKQHEPPVSFEPIKKLFEFITYGRDIYEQYYRDKQLKADESKRK